jgi:hypothetical protein
MKINFGVPKCRTGAVGAARVHRAKKLKEFSKAPVWSLQVML